MQVNLFVDMDGVLAQYNKEVSKLMFNENFFLTLPKMDSMVNAIKTIISEDNVNLYILTSLINSEFCQKEKEMWLDKHLPEIKKKNRLYVPYGEIKSCYVEKNVDFKDKKNILIDDFTHNLTNWTLPGAVPIKAMNGINGTNGTWIKSGGKFIDITNNNPNDITKEIRNIINS